jgi:hypothetical protein
MGAGGDLSALSESGVMPGGAGGASDFSYNKARSVKYGVKEKRQEWRKKRRLYFLNWITPKSGQERADVGYQAALVWGGYKFVWRRVGHPYFREHGKALVKAVSAKARSSRFSLSGLSSKNLTTTRADCRTVTPFGVHTVEEA